MSLMPKGMAKQHAREPGHVSVRNKTVAMVEGHLNKQRSAYDHWIAELCRDAEESAMERDRLKAKLAALRDDHKRKVSTGTTATRPPRSMSTARTRTHVW